MQALRILMLVVVLALAYLLMFRPTTKTADFPPDLVQASPAGSGTSATSASVPPAAHTQYKEAMDRAHAAAKQMQAQHADADSL